MSLNFKLLVNLTTENGSCVLNVCQFQFFSSIMNSSRSFTHWDQYDFFPTLHLYFSWKKRRKKIFYEISDLSIYCRSLPSCFRQLAFLSRCLVYLSLCYGNNPTILTSPSAKPGGKLTHHYSMPPEPLLKKASTEIDKFPPPSKANITQGSEIRQKIHLWLVGRIPSPSPKGQYISWGVWYFQRGP